MLCPRLKRQIDINYNRIIKKLQKCLYLIEPIFDVKFIGSDFGKINKIDPSCLPHKYSIA